MQSDTSATKLCLIKKSKRAFNLVESAIVLGVVGLVVGGIWVAAAALRSHFDVIAVQKLMLMAQQDTTILRTLPAGLYNPLPIMTPDLPDGFAAVASDDHSVCGHGVFYFTEAYGNNSIDPGDPALFIQEFRFQSDCSSASTKQVLNPQMCIAITKAFFSQSITTVGSMSFQMFDKAFGQTYVWNTSSGSTVAPSINTIMSKCASAYAIGTQRPID